MFSVKYRFFAHNIMSSNENDWKFVEFHKGGNGRGGYNKGGYNQGGYNQGGYNKGGYNKDGIQKNQVRKNVESIIRKYCENNYSINEAADKFIQLITNSQNRQMTALYLEIVSGYHFWEILKIEKVIKLLQNSQEGDGWNPFCWINWPFYIKHPIPGYTRTEEDAVLSIQAVYDAGYSPFETNKKNENVFDSLDISAEQGRIDAEWVSAMKNAYKFPTKESARRIVCSVMTKITPKTTDRTHSFVTEDGTVKFHTNYRTILCWIFQSYPEVVIDAIINQSLYCSVSMKDSTGYWESVTRYVCMYRDIIRAGPNKKSREFQYIASVFENAWNSDAQVSNFDTFLANRAFAVDRLTLLDTQFYDPIAAVIGESGVSAVQEAYIHKMANNKSTFLLALYCYRHTKKDNISPQLQRELANACADKGMCIMFLACNAFGSVHLKTHDSKFVNIKQVCDFLKERHGLSSSSGIESSEHEDEINELQSDSGYDTDDCIPYNTKYVNKMIFLEGMKEFQSTLPAVNGDIVSDACDNVIYGLEKFISDHSNINKELILENIIVKSTNIIYTQNVLVGFQQMMVHIVNKKKLFTREDIRKIVEKFSDSKIKKFLRESSDSPIWVDKVLEEISSI